MKKGEKRTARVKGTLSWNNWYLSSVQAMRLETGRQQDNEERMKIFGGEEFVIGWLQQKMFYWFNIQGLKPVWDSWVQSETEATSPSHRLKYAGYLHRDVLLQCAAAALSSLCSRLLSFRDLVSCLFSKQIQLHWLTIKYIINNVLTLKYICNKYSVLHPYLLFCYCHKRQHCFLYHQLNGTS